MKRNRLVLAGLVTILIAGEFLSPAFASNPEGGGSGSSRVVFDGCTVGMTGDESGPKYVPGHDAEGCLLNPGVYLDQTEDGKWSAIVMFESPGDLGNPEREQKYPNGRIVHIVSGVKTIRGRDEQEVLEKAKAFREGYLAAKGVEGGH